MIVHQLIVVFIAVEVFHVLAGFGEVDEDLGLLPSDGWNLLANEICHIPDETLVVHFEHCYANGCVRKLVD